MKRSVRGSPWNRRGPSPAAALVASAAVTIIASTVRIANEYGSRASGAERRFAHAPSSFARAPGAEPCRRLGRPLPQELDGLIGIPTPCHFARQQQMRRARRLLQALAQERIPLDPARNLGIGEV